MSDNFEKFTDSLLPTEQKPASEKAKNKLRFSAIPIARVLMVLLAGLISYLLIIQVHHAQVEEKEEQKVVDLASQRAAITAQNVKSYLDKTLKILEQFASKAQVKSAFQENNKAKLIQSGGLLRQQLEHVEYLRFFPVGKAELEPDSKPPIRFTELELIRLAEQREVRPEAVSVDNHWYLTLVVPVPTDPKEPVLGTLMVSISDLGLNQALQQNNVGLGQISLLQSFGRGKPRLVTVYGGNVVAEPQVSVVENTPWQVKFEPSRRLTQQAETNIPFILAGLGALTLLLIVVGFWLGNKLGRRIDLVLAQNLKGTWNNIAAVATVASVEEVEHAVARKTDILDVDIANEDEELLGLKKQQKTAGRKVKTAKVEKDKAESSIDIPDAVFRAYDIRGEYQQQISHEFAARLGQALGSEALDSGEDSLLVARDARLSSPQLTEFLIRGILDSGCSVINVGTVPTPLLYFACETVGESSSGVMVTASHNPGHENGFKVVMNGKCRSEEDIKAIRTRMIANNVYEGKGEEKRLDIIPNYINTIFSDVALAGEVSIVIDAANAVAGIVAPRLFEELGCQVTRLFCDLDGNFPNHSPDPSIEENLQPLISKVKEMKADLGIALDGDGDRLIVVTPAGNIVWPDRLLMVFAKDIVSRNPGADVVFDVKSTRHLNNCITDVGGRPIMWKTGHSPMKAKMAETGALVGGEYSGHIFIKDRWFGFDDGMYAAARLIEIMSLQGGSLDELMEEFPDSPNTPEIRLEVPEEKKFEVVSQLVEIGEFGDGKVTTLDGIRVDYANGWGLVRASNTAAHLTLRFEADDEKGIHSLKALFVKELRTVFNLLKIEWDHKV
ncbi:phosphomannomutase [Alteromonadaceae bacterium Bs31]|nr:phosphomannomutase [Alteromonadaceae bacterium Bs31]